MCLYLMSTQSVQSVCTLLLVQAEEYLREARTDDTSRGQTRTTPNVIRGNIRTWHDRAQGVRDIADKLHCSNVYEIEQNVVRPIEKLLYNWPETPITIPTEVEMNGLTRKADERSRRQLGSFEASLIDAFVKADKPNREILYDAVNKIAKKYFW